jgi:hypothetical protein
VSQKSLWGEGEVESEPASIPKLLPPEKADPCKDGDILVWKRLFAKRRYTYAALRVGGKWYTTASKNNEKVLTWEQLHSKLKSQYVSDVQIVTGTMPLDVWFISH